MINHWADRLGSLKPPLHRNPLAVLNETIETTGTRNKCVRSYIETTGTRINVSVRPLKPPGHGINNFLFEYSRDLGSTSGDPCTSYALGASGPWTGSEKQNHDETFNWVSSEQQREHLLFFPCQTL